MSMYKIASSMIIVAAVAAVTPLSAQTRQIVTFAKSTSSKTIQGSITGDSYIDYMVNAGKGQMLNVDLKRIAGSPYFNVTPPGADSAVHIGSSDGDSYTGVVTTPGNQVIRVYQMRATGRRGAAARYTLTVGVGGRAERAAAARPAAGGDALVKGTAYNATAQVPWVTSTNGPTGSCKAGVIRKGGGNATVELRTPDGGQRRIVFIAGRASSSDGGPVSVTCQGDLSIIRIGTVEVYRIPDAFVVGG